MKNYVSNDGELILSYDDNMYDYLGLLEALLNNGYTLAMVKEDNHIVLVYTIGENNDNNERMDTL